MLVEKVKRIGLFLSTLMIFTMMTLAWGTEEPSVPSIGEKLMTATDVLTRLMLVACFVVGIGFIFVAFMQYRTHRRNPKFVPLDKPIWYLLLGIILLGVIFLEEIFGGGTGSILHLKKQQEQEIRHTSPDLDAPIEPEHPKRK